ncbi:SgcJ/EcaC family oxidoreductase [Amycolatopsis sp. NPDC098790]|uniref:SgcJ/EcaC family oxidoreductase n=1 Tax=Amycolatopsis sp. NPDC098790 TaxID=3363939 RepID=UPI003802BC33
MTATAEQAGSGSPSADDQAAAGAVPGRIIAAWADHDAAAFADVFTEDGTMVLPSVYVQGRAAIREFMAGAFAGPYRGTRVTGAPVHLHFPRPDVAVVVTIGGVRAAGEDELPAAKTVRATWILVKDDGEWRLTAYSNAPRD